MHLVKLLYGHGAEIDEPDVNGMTPFATACAVGSVSVMDFILKHCPGSITDLIRLASGEVWSPLFFTASYGNNNASEYLMSRLGKLSLTHCDTDGKNAFMYAIEAGSWYICMLIVLRLKFLKHDILAIREYVMARTDNRVSAIWIAARRGDGEIIERLLFLIREQLNVADSEIRTYISEPDSRGITPLLASIMCEHPACTRLLLRNGADPCRRKNQEPLYLGTPLVRACLKGDIELMKLLLHAGARTVKEEALCMGIAQNLGRESIKEYLESTMGFYTRLHYATELDERAVIEMLRAGVNIHATEDSEFPSFESQGISPLDVAARLKREFGGSVPNQVMHVINASQPWTPETHFLFDKKARNFARDLLLTFQLGNGPFRLSHEIFITYILPFSIGRLSPALSRSEANIVGLSWL